MLYPIEKEGWQASSFDGKGFLKVPNPFARQASKQSLSKKQFVNSAGHNIIIDKMLDLSKEW